MRVLYGPTEAGAAAAARSPSADKLLGEWTVFIEPWIRRTTTYRALWNDVVHDHCDDVVVITSRVLVEMGLLTDRGQVDRVSATFGAMHGTPRDN